MLSLRGRNRGKMGGNLLVLVLGAALTVHGQSAEEMLRGKQRAQPREFGPNLALGEFLLEAGRAAEAAPFLTMAVQARPTDLAARCDLAVAYIEAGRLGEARKLIDGMPKSAAVENLEGQWLAASGQPGPAAARYQRAAEAEPSERHLFDWGNHLQNIGAAEAALKIFRYAAERFPKSARLKVGEGVALYALREYDAAAAAVCAGVDLNPEDLRPLVFLGLMIDLTPESAPLVRQRLEVFARRYPRHAQAQYLFGLSLSKTANPVAAEPFLRRAAAMAPRMHEPRLELGRLYAEANRTGEAIVELEAALRLAPELEPAHYRLGQLYQKTGQTELANKHLLEYRKLRARKPASREASGVK
jgi:Tfp pilus assembly protein PilF